MSIKELYIGKIYYVILKSGAWIFQFNGHKETDGIITCFTREGALYLPEEKFYTGVF